MPEIDEITKLIGAINPRYAANPGEVRRKLVKGIVEAAKVAKPKEPWEPWENRLVYDAPAQQLEPIYYWILDAMNGAGYATEKLVDNFSASPGSGYFAEIGARATRMQEEGMKMLGAVNTVIRSIITLLYDLREFEVFLRHYDLANSKDPKERETGLLGLKQRWMDRVDIQKGRASINVMTAEVGFTTLRDAFMAAKSPEDVDRMDLNERVKRVLKPRVAEFLEWVKRSEAELRKRYEIEKDYLKSQVGSLKLYTRWIKPYLKAAEELMIKEKAREPALTKAFSTVLLELCLLGKSPLDVKKEVDLGNLPKVFRDRTWKRKYYSCLLVSFSFRGIPTRHAERPYFVFGGRVDVSLKAFALNDDELALLDKLLSERDFEDALKLIEMATGESLEKIAKDVEYFLGKEVKEKLLAKPTPAAPAKPKPIRKDSYEESVLRALAERNAADACFSIYHAFKKSRGMATFTPPEWGVPPWTIE